MEKITLKAARVNAGYTLNQVSEIIGIGPDTISKYEKDSSNMKINALMAFSKLYNCPLDAFILDSE